MFDEVFAMVPLSARELGVRTLAILCQEEGAYNYLWADLAWREDAVPELDACEKGAENA